MAACEKCWEDAFHPFRDHVTEYVRLLKERASNPCTPKEQAGQWWDEERQCDSRLSVEQGSRYCDVVSGRPEES